MFREWYKETLEICNACDKVNMDTKLQNMQTQAHA